MWAEAISTANYPYACSLFADNDESDSNGESSKLSEQPISRGLDLVSSQSVVDLAFGKQQIGRGLDFGQPIGCGLDLGELPIDRGFDLGRHQIGRGFGLSKKPICRGFDLGKKPIGRGLDPGKPSFSR